MSEVPVGLYTVPDDAEILFKDPIKVSITLVSWNDPRFEVEDTLTRFVERSKFYKLRKGSRVDIHLYRRRRCVVIEVYENPPMLVLRHLGE